MTRERFQALADAYGGDIARWPEAERPAAHALLAADGGWARGALAEAEGLDAVLAVARPQPVSADLTDRILAAAPKPRARRTGIRWLLPAGMGAGLAAACAAGLFTGVQLAQAAAEDDAGITAVASDDLSLDLEEEA